MNDMKTKNLKKYLKSLDIDDMARGVIATYILYGDTAKHVIAPNEFASESYKNKEIPAEFEINEDVVGLMATVNAMVKDKQCPKNLRNRFYGKKLSVIEELIREGRCSEFYKEGNCYSLLVDEKYRFHQLKDSHPTWENDKFFFDGERDFVPGESLPFDINKYREFMISATYYLGLKRVELDRELRKITANK